MKVLGIATASVLLLSICFANEEVVEIGNLQLAKWLSGTVTDPVDAPIPDVQVIEVQSDWRTVLRSTVTDAQGHWSLPPVVNRKIYFIRLVKRGGFNEVRFRVRLDKHKGKDLHISLPLS